MNRPFLTTREAATYLGFRSTSAVRNLVSRSELLPAGAGGHGVHLFTTAELERFVVARALRYGRKLATSAHNHDARTATGLRSAPTDLAAERPRVRDFASSWISSKSLRVDRSTARTYARALEQHILPALGDYFFDELRPRHVQAWIDDSIRRGWTTAAKGSKLTEANTTRHAYTRSAISVWLRTLRTMCRDAMAELDLARDPTLRVELPQDERRPEGSRALSVAELRQFLDVFERDHVNHYALVATLAFTGLRFCHASALRWSDWSEAEAVLSVERKHVRGTVGPISRRKNAPSRYPVLPPLAAVLREHRSRLKAEGHDTEDGWMFPSRTGTLRTPNSLDKAWAKALDAAGIARRFTVHGLRYTFTDLIRRANVDAVVRRAMTGHVTAEMQHHYSHIDLDEMRTAMCGVFALLTSDRAS